MKITFIILLTLLYQASMAQSAKSFTDVNNKNIDIDSLQGTKLLIIVLPARTDTALNNQLLRFQKTYAQKVKVIGLVSVQAGTPSKESYATTYDSATKAGVIVSEGITSTTKADNERASVLQWMTSRSNSRQQDRYAVGSKYFLSEDGRLYAQLGKATSLDDPLVKCIVNTKVPTRAIKPKTEMPDSLSVPKANNP
jgi:hypothetical protein